MTQKQQEDTLEYYNVMSLFMTQYKSWVINDKITYIKFDVSRHWFNVFILFEASEPLFNAKGERVVDSKIESKSYNLTEFNLDVVTSNGISGSASLHP